MTRITCALLLVVSTGCSVEKPAPAVPPAVAIIETRDGKMRAPDSLPAGAIRFRLVRDSSKHNLVVFALAMSTDPASLASALDQAAVTPAPVIARGGPEGAAAAGDTADVYLTLTPGRYLLGCLSRGFASPRHVAAGEWKVVTVFPSTGDAAPAPTIELGLADFAFQTPDRWPAGDQVIKVDNIGSQEHIVLLSRLDEGKTLKDWIAAEGEAPWIHSRGGVSRLGPGQTALLPRNLLPGRYVLTCLIVDPQSGRLHAELGMMREIIVGTSS
jgi:hypothetical protein